MRCSAWVRGLPYVHSRGSVVVGPSFPGFDYVCVANLGVMLKLAALLALIREA